MHQPLNFMKLITDPANRPALRSALAQHDAMLVLSFDLQTVLWTNDEGAYLLGEDQAAAIIGQDARLTPQTTRQVLALDLHSLQSHNIMLRFSYGLQAALNHCLVTPLRLNEDDKALLITTAARDKAVIPALPDHYAVELKADGSCLHPDNGFAALGISANTLADLIIEAQDAEDRMVSRRVRAGQRTVQALLIMPDNEQGISLFITPKTGATAESDVSVPAPAQLQQPQDATNTSAVTQDAPAETTTKAPEASEAKEPLAAAHFVWKTSADGRFTEISPEFAAIVGNNAADIIGRKFSDVAQVFGFDADSNVAKLLNQHDTWSGKRIFWPVEGTDQRIPVDLAALPVFGRDKAFNGFSGFGVLHPALAEKDPESIGLALVSGPVQPKEQSAIVKTGKTAPAASQTAAASEKIILMEALRASQQRQEQAPAPVDSAPQAEKPSAQITDIRPARAENGLSQTERNAFREIADRLRREVLQKSPKAAAQNPAAAESEKPAKETPIRLITPEEAPATPSEAAPQHPELPSVAVADIPYPHDVIPANFNHLAEHATRPAATETDKLADKQNEDLHMLNGLPVPVLIHSADRLHFANPAFFAMTGYQSLDDLLQAGGIDALFAPADDSGLSGMILRLADGSEKIVEAHLQSVPWQGSRALMLSLLPELVLQADNDDRADSSPRKTGLTIVSVMDNPVHQLQSELALHSAEPVMREDAKTPDAVTAANRQELPDLNALQTQIDELTSILDTATDGVVIIGQDGKIRSLNQSAAALFGYDTDDLTGKSFAVLFAIESQRAAIDYIHGLSGDGVASLLNDGREVIGREAQGRFIPLFMTIGKLPASKGYCAVMRDITQWKRAEEELTSARQEAERASTHKTEFLARISHEIRTPLNAIIGFSELMAEEKFGPIGNERYREYLRDIHRSGNHVLALVNDLLDISKIEAGALDLEFEAVALNDALAEAVALMQPQANRERVIIRSSFSAFLPDIVADARSIRQVALNLLSNAIRFTGQGGQVIVSTSYEQNGQVVMRVRDTGIGMSQSELEQALKPFRQVSNHNSQLQSTGNPDIKDWRSQGTGLGLPLTKAMVEANRAQFTIESAPEQGTTVEIAFPPTRVLAE